MNDITRAIFICALLIGLAIVAISFIKTVMGNPVRHKLKVPLGREIVEVLVSNGALLKPYRLSQAFDARAQMEPTGEVGLLFRGKKFGIADPENINARNLATLLQHDETVTVIVQAMVYGKDSDGDPLVKLMLPKVSWFKRALKPLLPKD